MKIQAQHWYEAMLQFTMHKTLSLEIPNLKPSSITDCFKEHLKIIAQKTPRKKQSTLK